SGGSLSSTSLDQIFQSDDTLTGGTQDDTFSGFGGTNTYDGGAGSNTVDYWWTRGGVVGSFATGTATRLAGSSDSSFTDTFSSISNLSGGAGSDTLTGSGGNNALIGRAGNDILTGAGGTNSLDGGAGWDRAAYGIASGVATLLRNAN